MTSLFSGFNRNNFDVLALARILVIFDLVSILFSPPLSNISEGLLLLIFLSSTPIRSKILSAVSQPFVKFSLFFYCVISLATFWSQGTLNETWGMWWGWRKILLVPVVVGLFDEAIWKDKLLKTFIITTIICAILSWFSWIFDYTFYKYPAGITVRNHSTQAMFFAVAIFTCLVILRDLKVRNSLKVWSLFIGVFILMSNILFVTPGRSGYLALLVFMIIFIWSSLNGKYRYIGVLLTVLIMGGLFYSSTSTRDRIYQGYDELLHYKESKELTSIGIRIIMFEKTYKIILERPILGHGTGGYTQAYRNQISSEDKGWHAKVSSDPHNQYLTVTADQGFLGLIFFLLFIISALFQKETGKYQVLGLSILLVWSITSLFSSHFSTYSEGRFVYIWCGVMLALRSVQTHK